jgi:hypothetical protein
MGEYVRLPVTIVRLSFLHVQCLHISSQDDLHQISGTCSALIPRAITILAVDRSNLRECTSDYETRAMDLFRVRCESHVHNAVQYRNPSSHSSRLIIVGCSCSRGVILTTERIHKHIIYKLHAVKDPSLFTQCLTSNGQRKRSKQPLSTCRS